MSKPCSLTRPFWFGLRHLLQDFITAYCLVCRQRCTDLTTLCSGCVDKIDYNLYPCPRCALPRKKGSLSCRCKGQHTSLDSLSTPLLYTEIVRKLIYQWKFRGRVELTHTLIRLANQNRAPKAGGRPFKSVDLLVPVGMHWRAHLRRGFNQSYLLALALRPFLADVNRPPVKAILRSASRPKSQHALSRTARLQNARQQFWAKKDLTGYRILLIDDVMTTGATMENAAKALREAGALRVDGWCLTRSIDTSEAG